MLPTFRIKPILTATAVVCVCYYSMAEYYPAVNHPGGRYDNVTLERASWLDARWGKPCHLPKLTVGTF